MKTRSRARSWLYIPLILMALFYLLPIFMMLNTGFKGFDEVSLKTMWHLPTAFIVRKFCGGVHGFVSKYLE